MASLPFRPVGAGLVVLCLVGGICFWQRHEPAPQVVQMKAPVLLMSTVFDSVSSIYPSPDG
ncbi:hypothetical protein IAD21_01870 [Abditibacteriota bacterium]|nr:hypothetical protein IAD21_01870 [Abditibacteriota bacterium]